MTPRPRNRWQLVLIALLFLTPFAAAVLLRFGDWQPPRTRNHGELLAPPLPMQAVVAAREDGSAWVFENVEREWSLLLRMPNNCETACRERLEVLPRVREAMGRHAGKLHLFEWVDASAASADAEPIGAAPVGSEDVAPVSAASRPVDQVAPATAAYDQPPSRHRFVPLHLAGELPAPLRAPGPGELPELWLVDPHGYLVMHYPAGFDPSGLRKDLARLVR